MNHSAMRRGAESRAAVDRTATCGSVLGNANVAARVGAGVPARAAGPSAAPAAAALRPTATAPTSPSARPRRRGNRVLALLGLTLSALACVACATTVAGSPTTDPSTNTSTGPSTDTSTDPTVTTGAPQLPADQMVLQVWTGGGLIPPVLYARSVPYLTIYGDGSVYRATYESWGGPPGMTVSHADPSLIAHFVASLESSDLLAGDEDYGFPDVTDLPSTSVTVSGSQLQRTVNVYGLEETFDQYVDRPSEVDMRVRLREVITDAEQFAGDPQPYQPTRLRVLDLGPDDYGQATDGTPEWPGPDPTTIPASDGRWNGCLEVTDGVAELYAAALENDHAVWSTNAGPWVLAVVPLLPGEVACD